jgi:uncharacterized protein YfaP (DUF2135 family)
MKKAIVFLTVFSIGAMCFAQQGQDGGTSDRLYQSRVASRIAFMAMSDEAALWFTDADTGLPLEGARVVIDGAVIISDKDGLAVFDVPDDGKYMFSVEKQNYIFLEDTFTVMLGQIIFNKYSIPPASQIKQIKIVLDWAAEPPDLDIHVVKKNQYHISYRDMVKTSDGTAWLDRDDTTGYGPETVTITEVDNRAAYHIYVHNYSNRSQTNNKRLASSYATIRIYSDNKLAARYSVTPGNTGTIWYAADIINGNIKEINRYE